jgi:hypothetical protein
MVSLPKGRPLNIAEVSLILRESYTPIVLLAGAAKAGKTTLLASLHDAFQTGPFAGYLAAGSQTLIGFEERCFDSRRASGAAKPSNLRTRPLEGHLYYHMKVRDEALAHPTKQLLLLDMSGEYYERATESLSEAKSLGPIIHRADHFVHLVNGARLASPKFRTYTQSHVSMLMRRLFESNLLDSTTRVDILLTKWDLVLSAGGQLVDQTLALAEALFPEADRKKVARFRLTPVAARPHYQSSLAAGFGLSTLFQSWVEDVPMKLRTNTHDLPATPSARSFDRFGLRGGAFAKET